MGRQDYLIFLFLLSVWRSSQTEFEFYPWFQNFVNYDSEGHKLISDNAAGIISLYYGFSFPTQCASRCYTKLDCMAFNFNPEVKSCELLSGNDRSNGFTLIPETGYKYFRRETWALHPNALGACASNPCVSADKCIDRDDGTGYLCLCDKGWDGDTCDTEVGRYTFTNWQEWSSCSSSCGLGLKRRRRSCERAGIIEPDSLCFGKVEEMVACNQGPCPEWDVWSEWDACTTLNTCGRGLESRDRTCLHGGTIGVDLSCLGLSTEAKICNMPDCSTPVLIPGPEIGEGVLQIIKEDSEGLICSEEWDLEDAKTACKQMGFSGAVEATEHDPDGSSSFFLTGIQCVGSEETLVSCPHGGWQEEDSCSTGKAAGAKCIVDGNWSTWGAWGTCSVTCAAGQSLRTRTCDSPAPKNGGSDCNGTDTDNKDCVEDPCPVNGEWQSWGEWGECSTSCGGGEQTRERGCDAPLYDGEWCEGEYNQTQECNTNSCPVDGVWDNWSEWDECTKSCGTGEQHRSRICNEPKYGGDPCPGPNSETQPCNPRPCPIDGTWSEWSEWTPCNQTCGGGYSMRNRDCEGIAYGGNLCQGPIDERKRCNTQSCAVDGVWEEWSTWSPCSTSCENGTQTRSRGCDGPFFGGTNCTGDWTEEKDCFLRMCPIDGVWESWSPWGDCSLTCANGTKWRSRSCHGPFHGGAQCGGSAEDSTLCNPDPCPVDGEWEGWMSWTSCSLECGGGVRNRTRECKQPLHGGFSCEGYPDQYEPCNIHHCPVDGVWAKWKPWTLCTRTCGGGNMSRTRECEGPFYGGLECSGEDYQHQGCNEQNCPIHGIWGVWSNWEECSATCGESGERQRLRNCTGPFYGGDNCEGDGQETQSCNRFNCPINGQWSLWSEWTGCSVSCGSGMQERNRVCGGRAHGGNPCPGHGLENQTCNDFPCPIDGVWRDWSTWSTCSESCGNGTKSRSRSCDGPYHDGADCTGNDTDIESCFIKHCPIDGVWSGWSEWGACSALCGDGFKNKTRHCIGPLHDGQECIGQTWFEEECNERPCPIDCVWHDWSSWSNCTVACGGGKRYRNRSKDEEKYGGEACPGSSDDEDDCNTHHCPIDGYYSPWSEWGACSVTCDDGTSYRSRKCTPPKYGGLQCLGSANESQPCSDGPCQLPGIWNEWGDWSRCSQTSDGGTRARIRSCNTTIGLHTLPCENIADGSEVETCNEFSAEPLPIACEYAIEMGLINSDYIQIDPTRSNPFWAWCDVETGETIVHHDKEDETEVRGYEGPGEFQMKLRYVDKDGAEINVDVVRHLVQASSSCRQMLAWKCKSAVFNSPTNQYVLTYAENYYGDRMSYWGGASYVDPWTNSKSVMCSCGETQTCGSPDRPDPDLKCNCDANDDVWRVDEGSIKYKDDLPLSAVKAGDTGDGEKEEEVGFVAVGPIICSGKFDPESYHYGYGYYYPFG